MSIMDLITHLFYHLEHEINVRKHGIPIEERVKITVNSYIFQLPRLLLNKSFMSRLEDNASHHNYVEDNGYIKIFCLAG